LGTGDWGGGQTSLEIVCRKTLPYGIEWLHTYIRTRYEGGILTTRPQRSFLIFSFHLSADPQSSLTLFTFSNQNVVCVSHPSHAFWISLSSDSPRYYCPNSMWWREQLGYELPLYNLY
jgi:hypothetical protein